MPEIDSYVYMLTTIPSRLNLIHEVLTTLIEPIPIILNLPKYSIREKKEYPDAGFLKEQFPNLVINKCDKDYGPCTKLIPGISYLKKTYPNKNIGIVMVDDDMLYHKNLLTDLKYYHNKYPNSSIGFAGDVVCSYPYNAWNMKAYNHRRIWLGESHKVDFLHGYMGILHQSNFFDIKSISDFSELPEYIKFVDDEWFSYLLAKKNIDRIVCKHYKSKIVKSLSRDNGLNDEGSMNRIYQASVISRMVDLNIIVPYGNQSIGDLTFQRIPHALLIILLAYLSHLLYLFF